MKAFDCKMCGQCCYGKGGIIVSDVEVERIAQFLNIDPEEFKSKYTEVRNNQRMLEAGENGFCVFFDKEKQCLIHTVKPDICYLWPFYDANMNDEYSWDMAKDACPGINPDATFDEFVKQGRE